MLPHSPVLYRERVDRLRHFIDHGPGREVATSCELVLRAYHGGAIRTAAVILRNRLRAEIVIGWLAAIERGIHRLGIHRRDADGTCWGCMAESEPPRDLTPDRFSPPPGWPESAGWVTCDWEDAALVYVPEGGTARYYRREAKP